jgi:hypothetical protein
MFDEIVVLALAAAVNRLTEAFKLSLARYGFDENTKHILTLVASMIVGVFVTVGFQINALTMFPGFAGVNAFAGQVFTGLAMAGGGAVLQALIDFRRGATPQPPVIISPPEGGTTVATTQTTPSGSTTVVEQSQSDSVNSIQQVF